MNLTKINIEKLVQGSNTYPSWTTNSVYPLKAQSNEKNTLIYYKVCSGRIVSRTFPKEIDLSPNFCYVLGLLKGEGSTSLGKSNYRRLTITNSDPEIINAVLDELDKSNFFKKSDIINKSVHLLHFTKPKEDVINYWSKSLRLSKTRFKCFNSKTKTSEYGVCHVYISNVLLRRVIDLIQTKFTK